MVAKVSKSNGIFTLTIELDEQTAQRLNFEDQTELSYRCVDEKLVISRLADENIDAAVEEALDDTNERYGGMLRRLA